MAGSVFGAARALIRTSTAAYDGVGDGGAVLVVPGGRRPTRFTGKARPWIEPRLGGLPFRPASR